MLTIQPLMEFTVREAQQVESTLLTIANDCFEIGRLQGCGCIYGFESADLVRCGWLWNFPKKAGQGMVVTLKNQSMAFY